LRQFRPATEPRDFMPTDKKRANHIVDHVMNLSNEEAGILLADIMDNFHGRHIDLLKRFELRADEMEDAFKTHEEFNATQRQLTGAYFLSEYAFEAAALFNPSIILHPNQEDTPEGGIRFIMSLRAVGEGHVSSLTFRSGIIANDGRVILDPVSKLANLPQTECRSPCVNGDEIDLCFETNSDISERVIFPVTMAQKNGIEDVRFVRFLDDDKISYFATFTAYDGRMIRSEAMQTDDFINFKLTPLTGDATHNKGMALFPRKIGGKYAMITRRDNENMYLAYSDSLFNWNDGVEIISPHYPWEFVQIGNCGSPIEIDEGWLMLTHGVGPVRKYSIGAVLLDKKDPSKLLARSQSPLIYATPTEREGYVPNVVYTCGAIKHGDLLIIPFAISDNFTTFATIEIKRLLSSLVAVY
jgi:predicted GH43/DUF377 family glycosyl hydrolase